MKSVQQAPGLYYEAVTPPAEPSPLRSDIAGFVGRTRRGPVGKPVRVTGWHEYLIRFGGLTAKADTPFALKGYFENGGDVAHVVRLMGSSPEPGKIATAAWNLTKPAINRPAWPGWNPRQGNFTAGAFRVVASSPGAWANGLRVKAQYRRRGASGKPEVDLTVRAADEPVEHLIGLEPEKIIDQVAVRSELIRIEPVGPAITGTAVGDGPHLLYWNDIVLGSAEDFTPSGADYVAGLDRLADEAEVALVAMPDLIRDVAADDAIAIQQQAVAQAELLHDRLVLVDLPVSELASTEVSDWAGKFRKKIDVNLRAAVAYYPWLSVQDPFGGINHPLRALPPSGHVAGLISRYDRERGAHYTPANATLDGAIDVTAGYALSERAALNELGVNVLPCVPGRGIQVWGGRTLHKDPHGDDNRFLYIAHRRLIHRLIRGIRRVAEPLVFENNDAVLWLLLTRAVTTILSEAYTAGGLKGARPEQSFRVRCDATTNPAEERDLGRVLCEIDLAPAVPMEFITLRVALSASGTLDVFEK